MKIATSILGILLTMSAGAIAATWIRAEATGYLNVPYVMLDRDEWYDGRQFLYILACVKIIPYWGTTVEDYLDNGALVGRCSSMKSFQL